VDVVYLTRRVGWTLPELLVSLAILGAILGIASHFAVSQLRFYRASTDTAERRGILEQIGAIVGAVVSGVAVQAGDIILAQDTALEVLTPIGGAVACSSLPGAVVVPAATADRGNIFGAYIAQPTTGDRAEALVEDSSGLQLIQLHIVGSATGPDGCFSFGNATWTLTTAESITIPLGSPLRFTRPIRLSFYKSSDAKWYLGAKDWNGSTAQFNGIQPVTGPLSPFSHDPRKTGLQFSYRDSNGADLMYPFDVREIAALIVLARAGPDSSVSVVALRNPR
jgi:prepilin-type N-terminal cleavage/methylation domain-containing protein